MRHFLLFFIFILISIGVLLIWIGNSRISDYEARHLAIASETTTSVNEAVTRFISERRRLVNVFAISHQNILSKIIEDPDNQSHHDALIDKLNLFFPKHFTYSLADQSGVLLFEDIEGLVGNLCISDLKHFSETQQHFPRVHPNSEMYHFDIMVPFTVNDKSYTFFLSFNADLLAEILKNSTVPDHELILAYSSQNQKLIEATTEGARIHLDRNDFHMTSSEESRILRSKEISGTAWKILDLQKPGLLDNFNRDVYLVCLLFFSVFFIIAFSWYRSAVKIELIRLESDKHKSEFISTVSHELRTPLTAIKGSIGLIVGNMNKDLPDKALRLCIIALTNTDRLINIVNDLLDVQKIEAGKFSLELAEENLTELIQQSLESAEDYGRQFNVTYELSDLLPNSKVMVDSNRFIQVMNNLLSNAAKYGNHNDVVNVSITPYNDKIRVSVIDSGTGISDEVKNNVFSKFSQSEKTTSEKTRVESTGLGLYISKQLVTNMGANIDFTSSKNGTTFYIDLKRA